jgi:hypothetical protein
MPCQFIREANLLKAPLKPIWTSYVAQTRRDIGETTCIRAHPEPSMIENALHFYALKLGKVALECSFDMDGEIKHCA